MTNIKEEPFGGWVIVLFMVMSFVIGCVNRMCQSFHSGCVCVFFNHSFWPCCCNRHLTFLSLWEITFSGLMVVELSDR